MIVAIAIVAGGLGGVLRAEIGEALRNRRSGAAWATFAVNIVGAFVLGVVISQLDANGRAILGTGFTGGLTTYSAFALEPIEQWRRVERRAAIVNVIGSLTAGTTAAAAGMIVGGGWS